MEKVIYSTIITVNEWNVGFLNKTVNNNALEMKKIFNFKSYRFFKVKGNLYKGLGISSTKKSILFSLFNLNFILFIK